MKKFMEELTEMVKDVKETDFSYSVTTKVPNVNDRELTFEGGNEKKGKEITTFVVDVDIRNSVELMKSHKRLMQKVYTAFVKGCVTIAIRHEAFVRNIIGDRIVLIFPTDSTANMIDSIVSLNHFCNIIMRTQFSSIDFKCGIGVDYGTMRVIKVGRVLAGKEKEEHRNLVWVGDAANIASRLTDVANKAIVSENVRLLLRYIVPQYGIFPSQPFNFATNDRFVDVSKNDFLSNFSIKTVSSGLVPMYKGQAILSFNTYPNSEITSPVLLSEKAYDMIIKDNSANVWLRKGWLLKNNIVVRDVRGSIYGLNLHW